MRCGYWVLIFETWVCVGGVEICGVAVVGLDLRCEWLLWVQICGVGLDLIWASIVPKMDKLSGFVLKMKWSTQAVTLLEPWTLFLVVFKLVFDTFIKGTSSPVSNVPEQGLYVFLVHRFPN